MRKPVDSVEIIAIAVPLLAEMVVVAFIIACAVVFVALGCGA